VAGLFHLVTHAFFKSLLFLCSGSVIHACHTNDMRKMGGLAKVMPWTAFTMLVGCLAIIGAGIPFVIGLSGYYSKDSILAQALSFAQANPRHSILFYAVAGGAALTAFYMFRLWFMTFAGTPRDHHIAEHAHESPTVMVAPLVALAVLAVAAGWTLGNFGIANLLEQARPAGTAEGITGGFAFGQSLTFPA
jgi:NADH-quinone oxidoreductase subunit L